MKNAEPPKADDPLTWSALEPYIVDIVKNAMLTMWNYVCDDSHHHPLDIEHGKGKYLTFTPRHWAELTGKMVRENLKSALAAAEPPKAADEIIGQIEERFPDWKGFRDLVDCIDVTLHRLRGGS